MDKDFKHSQFAHCESGVVSTLLSAYGVKISEPMAFGITSSLAFVYLPIIKLNGLPLIAYRGLPKNIVNNISNLLNIKMIKKTYSDPIAANEELKQIIQSSKIVGLQTSVFYLPYFPKDMRFHFNAHNLLVYGFNDGHYLISDPVFQESVLCNEADLTKARFAKGAFAPKGFLYYPKEMPSSINYQAVIKKAIAKNSKAMLSPFPYVGVKGMNTLAKKIVALQNHKDPRYIKNFLTHIVRMQEEIGTGGGGFRFLYAAFLEEAIDYGLDRHILEKASSLFIKSGNILREFALACVNASKDIKKYDAKTIAEFLKMAASYEQEAYEILLKI